MQFARYCACAIDHIVQWFKLPEHSPLVASPSSAAHESAERDSDDGNDGLPRAPRRGFSPTITPASRLATPSSPIAPADTHGAAVDSTGSSASASADAATGVPPLATAAVQEFSRPRRASSAILSMIVSPRAQIASPLPVQPPILHSVASHSYRMSAGHWLALEQYRMQGESPLGSGELLLGSFKKGKRKSKSHLAKKRKPALSDEASHQIASLVETFNVPVWDVSGYVYWLVESMRACLRKLHTYYSNTTPAFVLQEQLKRIMLFLVDVKRTSEDNAFALLYLLYCYPLAPEEDAQGDTDDAAPSRTSSYAARGSSRALAGARAEGIGQLVERFAGDSEFTTRLLYSSSKLFTRNRDELLLHLTRRVWVAVIKTGRNYLKKIFPANQPINMLHPDFVDMIEEVGTILEEDEFNTFALSDQVEENVKGWESKESLELQRKLTDRIQQLSDQEKLEATKQGQFKRRLDMEQNLLHDDQMKFQNPVFIEMQQADDRETFATKKWRRLVKRLIEERSVLNAVMFQKKLLLSINGQANDLYWKEPRSRHGAGNSGTPDSPGSLLELQQHAWPSRQSSGSIFNSKAIHTQGTGSQLVQAPRSGVASTATAVLLSPHEGGDEPISEHDSGAGIEDDANDAEERQQEYDDVDEGDEEMALADMDAEMDDDDDDDDGGDDAARHVPYESDTFYRIMWKLDPTSGPHKVRIRLKRNRKAVLQLRGMDSDGSGWNPFADAHEQSFLSGDGVLDAAQALSPHRQHSRAGSTDDDGKQHSRKESQVSMLDASDKIIVYPRQCTRITQLRKYVGELILCTQTLNFIGYEESHSRKLFLPDLDTEKKRFQYSYETIREIHFRRYLLRNCAMEIFFTNGKSLFLAFEDPKDRDEIYNTLMKGGPNGLISMPNFISYEEEAGGSSSTGFSLFKKNPLNSITQKWQEGLISNFEYLMHLNTLAGRSFNDLTQYPVFPFILSDYDSQELDLARPDTFRDLSKPMGALSEHRLLKAIGQFEEEHFGDHPPCHWGSHYSTQMSVLYYLIRLEPFTRCFWELNGKRLDIPDRVFHSIASAWSLSSGKAYSKSDVKELIPEFFYLPEFLRNRNMVDFGRMQVHRRRVDDVELPPWAHGSPVVFVRKHREALESPYVSKHLHAWIDLIFGYKQNGKEAEKAYNLFNYFTYEGCIDEVENIDDPVVREARWSQITNFGQTPKQIFFKPHLERYSVRTDPLTIYASPAKLRCSQVKIFKESVGDLHVADGDDKTVHAIGMDKVFVPSSSRPLVYLSYYHWDRTLRISRWDTGRTVYASKWIRPEQCLAAGFSQDGKTLAIGSDASVVHVFRVNDRSGSGKVFKRAAPQGSAAQGGSGGSGSGSGSRYIEQVATLAAHSKRVLAVCISSAFSIILSGSEDHSLILWDLNRLGSYVRTVQHPGPVTCIAVSTTTGDIASFSTCARTGVHRLFLRTINGDAISQCVLEAPASCMQFTWAAEGLNRNLLVVGMANGKVALLDALELRALATLAIDSVGTPGTSASIVTGSITAIAINSSMTELHCATSNGVVATFNCSAAASTQPSASEQRATGEPAPQHARTLTNQSVGSAAAT